MYAPDTPAYVNGISIEYGVTSCAADSRDA